MALEVGSRWMGRRVKVSASSMMASGSERLNLLLLLTGTMSDVVEYTIDRNANYEVETLSARLKGMYLGK